MKKVIDIYKGAYSGLSKSIWWLSMVMLVNRSGTMVLPFMTLYLTDSKHFTIGQAGIVMTIFGAGAICGGLLGGRMTDKIGFYKQQLFALICGGLLFITLGQMKTYLSICIFTFLLSFINESFRPANAAAIAQYSKPENRTRSFSLNRLAINMGWAVGGTIGGYIASKNYHLLFWVDGLTNIVAAIMLRIFLPPTKTVHTNKHESQPAAKPDKTNSVYRDKVYLAFVVLTILFGCCFFQMLNILPVFYKRIFHFSPTLIGMLMALNGLLICLIEMALIYKLEGKRQNLQYITVGTFLTGLSFVLFNIFPAGLGIAIVATLVITAGEMLSMPFMNSFWIGRTKENNRGQYAGLYTVAWSSAQILGPGLGAQVAQYASFTTLWWIVGGISVIVTAGFYWLYTRTQTL